MIDAASDLRAEVARFEQWATEVPLVGRSGEWECDYSEWKQLWAAARRLIETVPVTTWTDAMSQDLLYALARDNEDEVIAEELGRRSDTLLEIARRAIASAEADAKWQIAYQLGKLSDHRSQAESLLFLLIQDVDEYVRRRALLALGQLKSEKTEQAAELAWQTGHEYQRMAALWALKDVGSPKLGVYLREAELDGREYLALNAREIRAFSALR